MSSSQKQAGPYALALSAALERHVSWMNRYHKTVPVTSRFQITQTPTSGDEPAIELTVEAISEGKPLNNSNPDFSRAHIKVRPGGSKSVKAVGFPTHLDKVVLQYLFHWSPFPKTVYVFPYQSDCNEAILGNKKLSRLPTTIFSATGGKIINFAIKTRDLLAQPPNANCRDCGLYFTEALNQQVQVPNLVGMSEEKISSDFISNSLTNEAYSRKNLCTDTMAIHEIAKIMLAGEAELVDELPHTKLVETEKDIYRRLRTCLLDIDTCEYNVLVIAPTQIASLILQYFTTQQLDMFSEKGLVVLNTKDSSSYESI